MALFPDDQIPCHGIDQFNYLMEDKKLTAPASNFGPASVTVWRPLWDDAGDVGFYIQGRTEKYLFAMWEPITEGHEVTGWRFHPVQDFCPIKEVVVFND